MKKHLALAAFLLLSPLPALAEDAPSLTVTGSGAVLAEADTATLRVIVETTDENAAKAAADNAAISQKVWNAALAAGALPGGISTDGYTLWPEQENVKRPKEIYRVRNSVKILVKDLTKTGAVSDAALKAGATRLEDVSFSLEAEERFKEQAVTRAVADAKRKADAIAAGLGCAITGLRSVSIQDGRTYNPRPRLRAATAEMDATGTDLTPDKQEIETRVTIVYEIG